MKSFRIIKIQPGRITDYDVVERILNGEKELYEILLKRYNQTLYRVVRGYLRDDEAEDVMQETYLKAFRNLHQFRGQTAAFSTWLIRIGINEALQSLRKRKRLQQSHIFENNKSPDELINLHTSAKMNPEQQLINNEGRLLIEQAIEQLPEKYRIVYILREVEGMKNPEIADCLEISESNVKVRFHRAKELLKEKLLQLSSNNSVFGFGDSRCDNMVKRVMFQITSHLS